MLFHETARCFLRPFTEADLELLFGLHASPAVAATTIDGIVSREQVKEQLAGFIRQQNELGYGQWAVFDKAGGTFLGRSGFVLRRLDPEQPPQIELRYAYHETCWGKGIATEVGRFWVQWIFTTLKPEKIAGALMPHGRQPVRIKVLEKIGMKYVKEVPLNDEFAPYFVITREEFMNMQPRNAETGAAELLPKLPA